MATFLPVGAAQAGAGLVHDVVLDAADVDGIVNHIPAAPCLAGMLADQCAGRGEGVVLTDQAHGVRAASFPGKGDIARDVHVGRAERHAGDGLLEGAGALALLHMGKVVFLEAL